MLVAERSGVAELPALRLRPDDPLLVDEFAREPDVAASSIFPLRASLMVNAAGQPVVSVRGLGSVEGAPARVVGVLEPYHREDRDRDAGASGKHRYVPLGDIAVTLGLNKPAVTQNVKRCREQLAEFYEAIEGHPPGNHLLVESRPQKGYRLDPDCRFVDPPDS